MYRLNPRSASDPPERDLLSLDRPREKLAREELETLTEVDLLSLVLGSGCGQIGVKELARNLASSIFLEDGNSCQLSFEDCLKIKGLGPAKAGAVVAALELGRRCLTRRGRPIHHPHDAIGYLQWLRQCTQEHFQVLYLDTRRRLLDSRTISKGTLEATLVHPREVFRPAFELNASALLVAHNHPSGDPEPSSEDIFLTSRLEKAAKLLGFTLVDHLIIGGLDWVSLRQKALDRETGVELFVA